MPYNIVITQHVPGGSPQDDLEYSIRQATAMLSGLALIYKGADKPVAEEAMRQARELVRDVLVEIEEGNPDFRID